ncbi:thermonuclease family protein [Pseudovibrio sp. Tun.PSC04-5.I4]|uniref:thermonuclease family protein n=1 Tax=Pseudovibrio sp. Tun.PSC04-5.I4 TaxID=1798213 RepID=UPI001AD91416|nr:thermonuclease family protein [Pseudovibrio sp. Tun.PSC04-5.I4]
MPWSALADPCAEEFHGSLSDLPAVSAHEISNPLRFRASDDQLYYFADLGFEQTSGGMFGEGEYSQKYSIFALSASTDRWGRKPAILLDEKRQDFSVRLIKDGMAIVQPQLRSSNCLKLLINLEKIARQKNKGMWFVKSVINDYRSMDYEYYGEYWMVEAILISVGQTRSRTYLNFGQRWTEDLTGIIQRGELEEFSDFGHDLSGLNGKRVRLRGVLQINKGPQIELKHPAQLELLD